MTMTDEDYVAELRSHGMLSTNQAADRIEQLTAERDKWQAAFDEACDAWQHTCEHEMDRANKAEAERDRAEDELYELQQTCITLRGKNEALPAVQPNTHVNETPKSEHVPGVMLTPATKGGA